MKSRSYYQGLENAELIQLTRGYHPSEDFCLLASVLADRLEEEEEETKNISNAELEDFKESVRSWLADAPV